MIIRTLVSSLVVPAAICLSTPTLDNPPSVLLADVQEPPAVESLSDTINSMIGNENKKRTKTIYLIRHAESLENVAYKGARRVQAAYASRKLPEPSDVIDAAKLTFKMFRPSVMNAELSELGRRQVLQLHDRLEQDKFLVTDVNGNYDKNAQDGRKPPKTANFDCAFAPQTSQTDGVRIHVWSYLFGL